MATKLECFILHHSEVVLTLVLLYSHAHSTEKHIFHKFLTRQITHRSHHSALVILILFTPIKKKKKVLWNTGLAEIILLSSIPCLRSPCKDLHQKDKAWHFGRSWAGWWLPLHGIRPVQAAACQQRCLPWSPACLSLPQLQQSPHCQTGAALHIPCWPREPLPHVAVCSADAVWVLRWRGCLKRALVLLWNLSLLTDCY